MSPNNNPELEEIELARILRKNGLTEIRVSPDCDHYLLYGFLKCYLKKLEEVLVDDFEPTDGNGIE